MKILQGDDPRNLRKSVEVLRGGGVVSLPTETVYGLAADALRPDAVRSIFEIKNRPANDPLIVHVGTIEAISAIAFAPPILSKLADAFWPGPLTVILKKKACVPDLVTSGLPSVAIRIPRHPLFLEILQALNRPLAAPSANQHGYVSPTRAEHVVESLGESCPIVLDGGPAAHGIESTILSLLNPEDPTILRPGPLASEDFIQIFGSPPRLAQKTESSTPEAPGNFKRHYSPKVHLKLHSGIELIRKNIEEQSGNLENLGVILLNKPTAKENWPSEIKLRWLSENNSLLDAAAQLYAILREMDKDATIKIVHCQMPPNKGIGTAINDRLRRAATRV